MNFLNTITENKRVIARTIELIYGSFKGDCIADIIKNIGSDTIDNLIEKYCNEYKLNKDCKDSVIEMVNKLINSFQI